MKRIKNFLEHLKFNDIYIEMTEKSRETYEFISKYLNVMNFDDYMNNDNLYQVVAYKEGEIVGVRIFKMKDDKIHLNYSAVIPSERNKELNKKMFDEIEKIGIKNNVSLITSNVRESNKPSLKSLLKSGFTINKNYELYYPDGEKKIPLFKKI